MSLSSPRFRNEPELSRVLLNATAFRFGSNGRAVHLVQMALIDVGIPLPKSTTSQHYSPDGVYGAETTEAVKTFQRKEGLKVDGVFGPLTLQALDRRHSSFTHRVNLHFRSLSLSDVPFERIMSSGERVYAQYGIELRFASGQSLGLSDEEQQRFNTVGQNCAWDIESGEFAELHRLGTPIPHNDVGVFIVNQFQEANVLGCGGHAATRPACAVTHNCSRWDPAHEVCHVLLTSTFSPVHSTDKRNLMFAFSSNGPEPLTLTDKQLAKIRTSPFCRTI
jgi:hypothetical protein